MKKYRLASVAPVRFPVLAFTLDDGLSGEVDLTDEIKSGSLFEHLADRGLFDRVAVSTDGRSLGWNLQDLGHEIDLGADSLLIEIETRHVHHLAERYCLQRAAAE